MIEMPIRQPLLPSCLHPRTVDASDAAPADLLHGALGKWGVECGSRDLVWKHNFCGENFLEDSDDGTLIIF